MAIPRRFFLLGQYPEVVLSDEKGQAAAVVPVHQEGWLVIHTHHRALHAGLQMLFFITEGNNFHAGAGRVLFSHALYEVSVI